MDVKCFSSWVELKMQVERNTSNPKILIDVFNSAGHWKKFRVTLGQRTGKKKGWPLPSFSNLTKPYSYEKKPIVFFVSKYISKVQP